jgi:SOS-response transcriptional repressor LexA
MPPANQAPKPIRPTKKQRQLLEFINQFIVGHGYSPSYREIMSGLNYTSVATVAVHIDNLIKRGLLLKRDHSARSLEVVSPDSPPVIISNLVAPKEEKWLVEKVEHAFREAENASPENSNTRETELNNLKTLVGALRVLGMEGAAQSFVSRLNKLSNN